MNRFTLLGGQTHHVKMTNIYPIMKQGKLTKITIVPAF